MYTFADHHMVTAVLQRDSTGFGMTISGFSPIQVQRITESMSRFGSAYTRCFSVILQFQSFFDCFGLLGLVPEHCQMFVDVSACTV